MSLARPIFPKKNRNPLNKVNAFEQTKLVLYFYRSQISIVYPKSFLQKRQYEKESYPWLWGCTKSNSKNP